MERVALVVERTGERLDALLNPSTLVVRRSAGVRSRDGVAGTLTGRALADHPLLSTGGGWTELQLDLLFDAALHVRNRRPGEPPLEDVRDLTRPLWNLAENPSQRQVATPPPLVRFVWGKAWNLPGVILAVAERLEQFAVTGRPRRSWLRLLLRRVLEQAPAPAEAPGNDAATALPTGTEDVPLDALRFHDLQGAEAPPGTSPRATAERLDLVAHRQYGDAALWPALAAFNGIDDPFALTAGQRLRLPPSTVLRGSGP